MDNITHFLTGALVADAIPYTKRLGPKAAMVAAIASAAPDLDMAPALIANFPPKSLSFTGLFDMRLVALLHRSYSHSFFYMALASFPLGYLAWRWSGKKGSWLHWVFMIMPAFFLHTILDLTNIWGVKAWLPFSISRSGFGTLPLVDPPILGVAAGVFLVNHVFRDSYPEDPNNPQPLRQAWRRKSAAFLDRRIKPTTIGVLGLAFVLGRVVWSLATAPSLAGWF